MQLSLGSNRLDILQRLMQMGCILDTNEILFHVSRLSYTLFFEFSCVLQIELGRTKWQLKILPQIRKQASVIVKNLTAVALCVVFLVRTASLRSVYLFNKFRIHHVLIKLIF